MITYVNDYTALISGRSWSGDAGAPMVVTYSFENSASDHLIADPEFTTAFTNSFQAFTAQQQALARQSIAEWASLSGIVFVEVASGGGDIRFGNYDFDQSTRMAGFGGYAFYPAREVYDFNTWENPRGGDVFINVTRMFSTTYGLMTHEIGHAIGLEHPHSGDVRLNAPFDNGTYSVMSYNRSSSSSGPGIFDREATEYLYGPSNFAPSTTGGILAFAFDTAAMVVSQSWGNANTDILGSSLNDDVYAGGGNDRVGGFSGDDSLNGEGGNDTLIGGTGDDRFRGGAGDDRMIGGVSWDDTNGGTDTVIYDEIAADLTLTLGPAQWNGSAWVNASSSQSGNDEFFEIDNAIGGGGNDEMTGNDAGNILNGGVGNDTLIGAGGDDTLRGGDGADDLRGGGGTDIADYSTAAARVKVDLLDLIGNIGDAAGDSYASIEIIRGSARNDALLGDNARNRFEGEDGADDLRGRAGRDTVLGGEGADALNGGKGRDRLEGGAQDDLLRGTRGHDNLQGGKGNDTLDGGAHNDLLSGGRGNDLFIFADGNGNDVVSDFDALNSNEKIDLSGVSAISNINDLTGPGGAASQQGMDVLIDTGGGNSILLENVSLADLDAGDFIF